MAGQHCRNEPEHRDCPFIEAEGFIEVCKFLPAWREIVKPRIHFCWWGRERMREIESLAKAQASLKGGGA